MDTSPLAPLLPAGVASTTSGNTADAARQTATADFESFLTLLTAQLRNQDPLSPLDSTEFVAQLASFSTVEQLVGTNERLDVLTDQSFSGNVAVFANWIGQDVVPVDGGFRATGDPVPFKVPLVAGSDRIDATIRDLEGRPVAEFQVSPDQDGRAVWDGLNAAGSVVSPTDLVMTLTYTTGGSLTAERAAEVPRLVTGVRGTAGGVVLDLADGGSLNPDAVGRILQSGTKG